jgi:hypothetical protein
VILCDAITPLQMTAEVEVSFILFHAALIRTIAGCLETNASLVFKSEL